MDLLFRAVAESVAEAVVNSLLAAGAVAAPWPAARSALAGL